MSPTVITLLMLSLSGSAALRVKKSKLKAAYAVFVTDLKDATMKDVLAVQAYSLKQAAAKSRHDVEILALVPERLPENDQKFLEKIGFAKVIRKSLPVQVSEIDPVRGKEVRAQFARTQGSGDKNNQFSMAEETLKYWPLSMTEYDRVLTLDADVMVLDPMDELMECREDFVGTYDHGLDSDANMVPPVQGGFLLYRPNVADFHEIQKLTKEGDFSGMGWKNSKIGYAYGGTGPDGLLAYYFHKNALDELSHLKQGKKDIQDGIYGQPTKGVRMFAADRSKYDFLINTRLRQDLWGKKDEEIIADIKSVHFTGDCLKPWQCLGTESSGYLSNVCDAMVARWFDMRAAVETELNQSPSHKGCVNGHYKTLYQ